MSQDVDISGLPKAAVLAALFNAAAPQGMGFLQAGRGDVVMTVEKAEEVISTSGLYFDYLFGRPLKVDLEGDSFNPWGFDRDTGEGVAQQVIDRLRQDGEVNGDEAAQRSSDRAQLNAHEAMDFANTPTTGSPGVISLGGADVSHTLMQAVDRELERRNAQL